MRARQKMYVKLKKGETGCLQQKYKSLINKKDCHKSQSELEVQPSQPLYLEKKKTVLKINEVMRNLLSLTTSTFFASGQHRQVVYSPPAQSSLKTHLSHQILVLALCICSAERNRHAWQLFLWKAAYVFPTLGQSRKTLGSLKGSYKTKSCFIFILKHLNSLCLD